MLKPILESDVCKDETIEGEATQLVNQSVHQDTAVEEAEAPVSDSDASSDGSDAPLPPKLSRSFGRTPSPEQLNIPPSPLTETIKQQSLRSSFQSRALSASPQNITEQPQPQVQTSEDLVDIIHTSGVCSYSGFNRGLFVSLTDLNEHGVPKTPPAQQLEPLPLGLGVLQEQNTTHINSPDKSKAFIQIRSILG